MTKTVEDNAIMLHVLGQFDPKDPISINEPPYDYRAGLRDGMKGIKIGVPTDDWVWKEWVTEEHEDRVRAAIKIMEGLGAHIIEVALPLAAESRALMDGIEPEALWWKEHAHLFENLDGWGEVQAAILAGSRRQLDVSDYVEKARKRLLIGQELVAAFKEADVIAMPTGMTLGDSPGLKTTVLRGREVITPVARYVSQRPCQHNWLPRTIVALRICHGRPVTRWPSADGSPHGRAAYLQGGLCL